VTNTKPAPVIVDIDKCLSCSGHEFKELYESTFNGSPEEAIPYFLTDRIASVHGQIMVCTGCGFVFTNPQFTPAAYNYIYSQVTSIGGDSARSQVRSDRFQRHRAHVESYANTGKFLDIGAGDGGFLDAMSSTTFDGVGFDVREDTIDDTQTRTDIVVASPTESLIDVRDKFDLPFDFITAWDVLEHLADIENYMTAIREMIKPGGYFFATVPNINSVAARIGKSRWNCMLLEHLWYFSPQTYEAFCRRFDMEVIHVEVIGYPADVGTISTRLSQMVPGFSLNPPNWLSQRAFTLPIGLMFVVCKVPD